MAAIPQPQPVAPPAPAPQESQVAVRDDKPNGAIGDIKVKSTTNSLLPPAHWAPYTHPFHCDASYKRPFLKLRATGKSAPYDYCYGFKFVRDPCEGGLKYTLWCWHTFQPTPVSFPIDHSDHFLFWDMRYRTVIVNGNPVRIVFEDWLSAGVESLSLSAGPGGFSQGGFSNTGYQQGQSGFSNTGYQQAQGGFANNGYQQVQQQVQPSSDSAKTEKEYYPVAYVNKPFDIDFSGEAERGGSIRIAFDKSVFNLESAGTTYKEISWTLVPHRLHDSSIYVFITTAHHVYRVVYNVTVIGTEPSLTTTIVPTNLWFPDFKVLLDQALVITGNTFHNVKLLRAQADYSGTPGGVTHPWELKHITAFFVTDEGQVSILSVTPGVWGHPSYTADHKKIVGLDPIDIDAITVDLYNPQGVDEVIRSRGLDVSYLSAVLYKSSSGQEGPKYDVSVITDDGAAFNQEVNATNAQAQARIANDAPAPVPVAAPAPMLVGVAA